MAFSNLPTSSGDKNMFLFFTVTATSDLAETMAQLNSLIDRISVWVVSSNANGPN